MTDKRKKRPAMAATSSHYDTTSRDFHVVNIGDAAGSRRRSASAGRSESWMAKVTTAMSHRLFSGRRLSGSRSTQVMPMFQGKEQASHDSSRGDATSDEGSASFDHPSRDRTLRQVASEAALPRSASTSFGVAKAKDGQEECPTVVCDIEPNECSDDEASGKAALAAKCSVSTIHVRTPQKTSSQSKGATQDKVRPRGGPINWSDDETPHRTGSFGTEITSTRFRRGSEDEPAAVQTAAPVLKDFFTRSATTTHRERAQQRESRRGQHYRSSKERHNRLRENCRQEDENQAEQMQREKIERLRKLNQQRRIQMRQEASTLKKSVAASKLSTQSRFEAERERWEQEFQTEIDTLGRAYRRAYAQDDGSVRPITVAGMAVPEALSHIQRNTVNEARRVHTAAPSGWSSSMGDFPLAEWKELSTLNIEDSKDVRDVFADDASIVNSGSPDPTSTLQALLAERDTMARRIALLEQELEKAKLCVMVEAANTVDIEDGFFI